MLVVGVIEIIAGIGVALKPRIFAYVVAAWLVVIIAIFFSFPVILTSRCATSVCFSVLWLWPG